MSQTVEAIFDGEVFRPETPLDLRPNTRYRITIESLADTSEADVWTLLGNLTGSIEAPADWASEHDHYLYGTPKCQQKAGE
ncbi:MAG TPA: antitoxin family protein [Chthonomonadaceae bacterium]|nr:antitoxin family protein [Chthonomonadaceae bacterium]